MMMESISVALILLLIQFKDCCGQNASRSCNAWDVCGKYGICTKGNCSCPYSFTRVNPQKPEKGCKYQGNPSTEVLALTGFIYINNTDHISSVPLSNISYSDCLNKVSSNEHNASYYNAASQLCYPVNPVGSLVATEDFNDTAFFHVSISKNENICAGPYRCGSYGICNNDSHSRCSCPTSFLPIDSQNLSKGCTPVNSSNTGFLNLTGVSYSSYQLPNNVSNPINASDCMKICEGNINCLVVFSQANKTCFKIFGQVGTLANVTDSTFVTYLWVNITETNRNHRNSTNPNPDVPHASGKSSLSAKDLAGIIVGIILFIVCPIVLVWCYLVTCRIQRVKDNIEHEEPLNLVQNCDHEESKDIRAYQKQEGCKDVSRNLESGLKVYSSSQIQGMTKDYKDKIREDGFAAVYKAQSQNGMHLTVKVLKTTGDFSAEISTISQMHHTNLVQLLGYCNHGSHRVLVYEYVVNDSLDAWIFNNIISPMSWKKRFNIITGIASGMAYLHGQQVLHLDLKAQNIFVDAKFHAKIGLFGLNTLRNNLIESPEYVAPEYFIGTDRNGKMDVYSFGVILLEIVSAERVLNLPGQSVIDAIANCGNEEFFPSDLVDNAIQNSVDKVQAKIVIQVAFSCLQRDPGKRPSMADALLMLEGKSPLPLTPSTQDIMLQQCCTFKP